MYRQAARKGAHLNVPKRPLHGPRKARYFKGWGYPKVGTGNQVRTFSIELSAENIKARKHYDDPANILHTNDISGGANGVRLTGIIGKPVMVEHGHDKKYREAVLGQVDTASLEPDGRIFVTGRVFGANEDGSDNELGLDAIGDIDAGVLQGLSLRWRTLMDENTQTVLHKDVIELSLCNKPHYKGCVITTACAQPASVGTKYDKAQPHAKVKAVERILNLTMQASTQQETTQAAAPQTNQAPAAAAAPSTAPSQTAPTKDPAVMIEELTRKLQAENEARRAAEAKAQANAQWRAQKEAEEKKLLDAQKEEAIKPLPHLLQALQKHGEVDQIHQDTAEMLAHVLAEPVVNQNQQLGTLITACSAKLEKQEKLIEKLSQQVKRTGNASSVAELHMAASAAEDLMNLVEEPRQSKTGAGVADPMLQEQSAPAVYKAGSLPDSFYGQGWDKLQPPQASTGPSLRDRLQAQRYGVPVAQPQRAIESAASAAPTQVVQRAPAPVPQKLMQQQQQQHMMQTSTASFQQEQLSYGQDFSHRIAKMNPQHARDLIQVSSFQLPEGQDLPQYRGDVFN
jgi:hypothetical protein